MIIPVYDYDYTSIWNKNYHTLIIWLCDKLFFSLYRNIVLASEDLAKFMHKYWYTSACEINIITGGVQRIVEVTSTRGSIGDNLWFSKVEEHWSTNKRRERSLHLAIGMRYARYLQQSRNPPTQYCASSGRWSSALGPRTTEPPGPPNGPRSRGLSSRPHQRRYRQARAAIQHSSLMQVCCDHPFFPISRSSTVH